MTPIFKARTGSHLYGLSTPESDEDFVGVFLPDVEELLGLQPINEISNSTKNSGNSRRNNKDDVDDKFFSLQKFLHLALNNNPNIVELLFVNPENKIITSPQFTELENHYDKIISQKVYSSFKGYAYSQKHKLITKKERFISLQNGLEFIKNNYSQDEQLDKKRVLTENEANGLNFVLKVYKNKEGNPNPFHKGMPLKMITELLQSEYNDYGWRVKTKTFETLGYDVKFGYHLVRLLFECKELLTRGYLTFPLTGNDKLTLMSIRNGEVNYDEILAITESLEKEIDKIYENKESLSDTLRYEPNRKWTNEWLVKTMKDYIIK